MYRIFNTNGALSGYVFVNVILIIWRNHHEWYKQGLCMPITANFESSRLNSLSLCYILHSEELKTCRSCLSWLLILFGPRSCKKVNCRWWNVNKKNDKNFPPNTYINNICFQWQFTCKWSGHKYFVMIERTRPPARA